MSKTSDATALLEESTKECGAARQKAELQATYLTAKAQTQQGYNRLEKLPTDSKQLVSKELEEIKTKIGQATETAEKDKKPAEAMPLLEEADKLLAAATAKADMHAGLHAPVPNVDYLKMMVKDSGGTKMLDEMVARMDENTNKNVLQAALETRFPLKLKQHLSSALANKGTADKTAPDKSVKRIYELLLKVPETHAAGNPKIAAIERQQEDTGGAVYSKSGKIGLSCGRAGAETSHNQGAQLCSPMFFPDGVDPECQPPDDAKKNDVRYFDWATLHEVGHAVDDNKKFMDAHQSDPNFGGWQVHGADPSVPAQAAKDKFKYDLAYIKDKLNGLNPAPAAKPADRDAKDWKKAQDDVDEWCRVVLSYGLWWNGELTKKIKLGDRVYQNMADDGKPRRWVSYEYAARKRGIHGYQFRAPGEWFAELYAAYYMGMLKPEHPAVKTWLPKDLG
jgi:hypothetical protein